VHVEAGTSRQFVGSVTAEAGDTAVVIDVATK
jgi:hypothetical protein